MRKMIAPMVAVLAAGSLAGDAPANPASPEALAMLDPSRLAAGLCGGRRGGDALRSRLRLAASLLSQSGSETPVRLIPVPTSIRLRVTSAHPLVPRYVRQGLLLAYGFNHEAAIQAFRTAQRLDPSCAICFWGEAYALGPNINAPMAPEALGQAIAATREALRLSAAALPTEPEQALIAAMARRYSETPLAGRAALDRDYSAAMLRAAEQFPRDDDIALIAAESVMNTRPWDYWEADGRTPKGRIGTAVRLVETVLARSPGHPQAAHLYIHLVEASADPRRAEAAADRLDRSPIPSAGHLVHMPGHIYYRLGRFADSIRANIAAARADEAYLAGSGPNPMYRYGYYPHNVHFLLTSAQMAGDMRTVLVEAPRLARIVNVEVAMQVGFVQAVVAAPYLAVAQVGTPEQVLALREADARLPYVVALRHYARALARAEQRDQAGFEQEVAALAAIRTGAGVQPMIDQGVPARDLLAIAEHVARARWAMAAGRFDEAIGLYRGAAALEPTIPYQEPPYWYYPVRQSLGAALFRAGRFAEAKAAFQAALAQSPNNGWVLFGLAETERALGHPVEAAAADAALRRAWLGDRSWLRMDRL
jgi:tetratricopeptide (TPR) repeat protein